MKAVSLAYLFVDPQKWSIHYSLQQQNSSSLFIEEL